MSASDPTDTPAMRQYMAFKKQHPECVLFFRMGDFYEMFFDDALLVHKVLGITLTERTKGVPMAGVPYHAVENYLRRMIEQGYRVAVADQVQDPREAKGVVDRAVTRVLTAGTLVDETLLDDARSNHVAAVLFTEAGDDSPAVLALAELSTGSFEIVDVEGGALADEVNRLGVDELLYAETATGEAPPRVAAVREASSCALTGRPTWHFRHSDGHEALSRHFGVATLAGFGLADDDPGLAPAGALLRYLSETQGGQEQGSRLAHIRPPIRRALAGYLTIDATSLRSLEVERTMRTGETDGSLMGVFLRHVRTPMGKRLLRDWLCFPLRDIEAINARQRPVEALIEDRETARLLGERLGAMNDVARIAGRMNMGRATPRDLVALGRSAAALDDLHTLLAANVALHPLAESLDGLGGAIQALGESIVQRCVDSPPNHLREGGLVREGVDAQLDECRSLQTDANDWLARYQRQLIESTGINSLKVGYNRVFGYYIEVTAVHSSRVPDTFSRKQTLKNAERYITPDLKEFESKILTARDRAIDREQVLFAQMCREAAGHAAGLAQFARLVAELDVLRGFAEQAVRGRYVRPKIVEETCIDVVAGRHPVLDEILKDRFVPNDCRLGVGCEEPDADAPAQPATLALITGPNMAGKSTYIRQIAIITLLAHTGSFVPAESATIGLTDRLFTRIGASDELHAGRSTFMVEMTETANILHHATQRSLVILDEIGRGTSTLDGLSLAWAIAEQLARTRARTLFATHYHELTSIAEQDKSVCNLHVAVREWADEIIFLYRIVPGRTDRSYGIHVAKIAGLPSSVVQRALGLLDTLEVHTERTNGKLRGAAGGNAPARGEGQLHLFTEFVASPVLEELRKLDFDGLTPLQAFDALRRLREIAEQSG
ncbi:MAG: DNA mismatch repair protein MutS [Phycisphaerales bacterium]|nr:DNA mismatch repair protein MutS [Phycisphaerales bacterium]